MPFRIEFVREVDEHLAALSAAERRLVKDSIDKHLVHQADQGARNRKKLSHESFAAWELRIGYLRVYYDIEADDEPFVTVLAVGKKVRNQVFIGGEEVEV